MTNALFPRSPYGKKGLLYGIRTALCFYVARSLAFYTMFIEWYVVWLLQLLNHHHKTEREREREGGVGRGSDEMLVGGGLVVGCLSVQGDPIVQIHTLL